LQGNPFNDPRELHYCQDALTRLNSRPQSHNTIHVFMMSKCPFASRALQSIIPAMIRMPLDSVKLRLDFIGHGSANSMTGLQSLHGSDEVVGDKLYLCIQEMALPIQLWLLLVACISSDPGSVPHNAPSCFEMAQAPGHGIIDVVVLQAIGIIHL
jgi:hypothetical protein